ncbi:tRNA pseudouridine(55) synthase TruB [Psychrobacter aestuarii]|uniref:tRNA pseudouridine synthase B n=1 Tax=Psychrobacter aestuarii TaxID=556327 RepID=A0ABP3FT32_9GAMM|nr:tRNA pseudouridine(55) synthase TruB [Psychrobacter aestuarii]
MSVTASASQEKQKVSGVLLIDKPIGMTSQQVVSKVKYLFQSAQHNSKKAGHTGTLDPMATGLLPVCLGEATKFSHYQLDADKAYIATVQLGSQTDTGDADGQVIATHAVPKITEAMRQAITTQFLGAQQQTPPMYSALKKDGKKLYEYAREGIEIDRPARHIDIKALRITQTADDVLQLTVTCSKGTYIRVLGEDIAQALGTVGHLTALRRTQVGAFVIDDAISLAELEAAPLDTRFSHLLPLDACIEMDRQLTLSEAESLRLQQGQRLNVYPLMGNGLKSELAALSSNDDTEPTLDIKLINEAGEFIGLGMIAASGRLQPKKMIQR